MSNIEYDIDTTIIDDLPKIIIEFRYQDEFSDDRYVLKSKSTLLEGSKNIPFKIMKNYNDEAEIVLSKRDFNTFITEFFNTVDDYDFKERFDKSEASELINEQIEDFFNRYDDIVVSTGITTEGEVKRMKQLAGLARNDKMVI